MIGSKGRGERRKARRADWEDIDEKIGRDTGAGSKSTAGKKKRLDEDPGPLKDSPCGILDSVENEMKAQENASSPKMGDAQDTATVLEEDVAIS